MWGAIYQMIALLTSVAFPPVATRSVKLLPAVNVTFVPPESFKFWLFTILNEEVPVFVIVIIFVGPEFFITDNPNDEETETVTAIHGPTSIVDVADDNERVLIVDSIITPLPGMIFSTILSL